MLFMKKQSDPELHIFHTEDPWKIPFPVSLQYPFEKELLALMKEENHFPQEYYLIQKNEDYAFFIVYHNTMNIFTLGHRTCNFPVKVIGFPCSLSNAGYVTNNEAMMLDYIKTIKGGKLILNVDNPINRKDFVIGQTLPTCILNLPQRTEKTEYSMEDYMNSLRSGYRRRIRKAIHACRDMEIRCNVTEPKIHDLYLNTYHKSDYKLERLESGFFKHVDATNLVFYREGVPIGFVLLKENKDQLIFMLCGMDYSMDTTDLYYYMIYNIIRYAMEHHYRRIDLGQTSEETKMKFGAHLEKKYFYAHHTNPLLNLAIHVGRSLLEYHYQFPQFRVFKEKENESTVD